MCVYKVHSILALFPELVNNAPHCKSLYYCAPGVSMCYKSEGCSECWGSWKDKPVANIAAYNIIIICENFCTSTCGSKHNSHRASVLRLQKAISVLNMRAELRLQRQSMNVIKSPSRIWEEMNIVWNNKNTGKKQAQDEGEKCNIFMQISRFTQTHQLRCSKYVVF